MKKILCFVLFFNWLNQSSGQTKNFPLSELQYLSFSTEVHGMTAMMRNPAGLSIFPNDDGAFFNYNFLKASNPEEINFALTMKNLAFAVQQFPIDDDAALSSIRSYKLGLSVGGKVLSIGTSNKIVELQSSIENKWVFSFDAGVIFQPAPFLSIAAHVRDLNEPVLEDYQFRREFSSGFGLRLLNNRFKILAEAAWDDNTRNFEQSRLKAGLSIMPIQNFEILVGGIIKNGLIDVVAKNEEFYAILQIPFWGGIRILATARMDGQKEFLRYSASSLIPLKTIAF
ncbi:MAG: hypothetical protein H6696_04220 [Deferribacteres bacterium]|nr:hypothetical protein [candidate division KSB1 bacterium]MCB9501120.1 hypothetical protein [Deferribacteres bacterium]